MSCSFWWYLRIWYSYFEYLSIKCNNAIALLHSEQIGTAGAKSPQISSYDVPDYKKSKLPKQAKDVDESLVHFQRMWPAF